MWRSLTAEAGIAVDQIGEGATMLGESAAAAPWTFARAFFPLSIGLERASKLALQVETRLHTGEFLNEERMRRLGHNLGELLDAVKQMTDRSVLSMVRPTNPIHESIISVLSNFATGGRYHHLDNIAGRGATPDPARTWWDSVISPILDRHYSAHQRQKDERTAELLDQAMSSFTIVMFTHVDGSEIRTVYQSSLAAAQSKASIPWARMYTLQLVRWLAEIFEYLTMETYRCGVHEIPVLNDFFAVFRQADRDLRSRKVWRPSRM